MKTLLILLALSATAFAGASSYDGNPPGTLEQLTGRTFRVGYHVFPAGTWHIDISARITAWQDNQIVVRPLGLFVGNSFTFTATEDWHLEAITRDFPQGTPSDRWKYTEFILNGTNPWQFGMEDMRHGDEDFQDAVGLIVRLK